MARYYELVLSMDGTEDGGLSFLVAAPSFPEITTFGDDLEDACRNGLSAIEEAIAARIHDSEEIPLPLKQTTGNGYFVQLSALIYLKTALYMICREKDISRAELARRLKWHREQVDRLFRLDHKSQLDQLEAAFNMVGVPLSFDLDFPQAA